MTIAVLFEKGIMIEPSNQQIWSYILSDHRNSVYAVLVVLFYYFFAWNVVGRGPKKGLVIPLFSPPSGVSPALMHFVHHRGWKKSGWTAFSASIVSLSTKGMLSIGKVKKNTSFTSEGEKTLNLPRGELVIDRFIRIRRSIIVNEDNGSTLKKTRSRFLAAIQNQNQNTYFLNNYKYVFIGLLLSALYFFILSSFGAEILLPITMIIACWILFKYVLIGLPLPILCFSILSSFSAKMLFPITAMIVCWIFIKTETGKHVLAFIKCYFFSGFFFDLCIFGLTILIFFHKKDIESAAIIFILLVNWVFLFLLRAPTIRGRKIMDQIEGFKMYLETAEAERLNFHREPDFTVKRFEKIPPFAIALGVEKPWANRLEVELSHNTLAESKSSYQPNWYLDLNFSSISLANDISNMASDMSSALIAAEPSPAFLSGGGGC